MALTNCKKISDVSISVTKNQSLGSTDAVMFIDPIDADYVVAASNFQNNTSGLSAYINTSNNSNGFVNGIKLSDTTTAYASDNRIRVDIDLLNSFSPSSNTELTIDIDGEATHNTQIPYTIAGSYRFDGAYNINQFPAATTYSESGALNDTKTLFTVTFQAQTGYYMPFDPTYFFNSEDISDYTITIFNKVYTNELLTYAKIKVEYTFPANSRSGDSIVFNASQEEIPSEPTDLITEYEMDTSTLPIKGGSRDIKIKGSPGASFIFKITKPGSPNTTYNFISPEGIEIPDEEETVTTTQEGFTTADTSLNGIIPSSGVYLYENISFPASLTSSIEYSLDLRGGTDPVTNTLIDGDTNNTPFEWKIKSAQPIVLRIAAGSSNVSSIISSTSLSNNILFLDKADTGNLDSGDGSNIKQLSIVVTGTKNLFLRRDPIFSSEQASLSDFSNSVYQSNGGMWWKMDNLRASGDGTTTITIEADFSIFETGNSNVVSTLNLDNIINRAPVATTGITFSCNQGKNKIITLTGTDSDGDNLGFVITTAPTHGQLFEINDLSQASPISSFPHILVASDKNKVLFKHDNSTNFNPTFGFKANDGFEDSVAEATVTGTVIAANIPPTADSQQVTVNQGEAKIITLTGADSDGDDDNLRFKITGVPSTSEGTLHTITTSTDTNQQGLEDIDTFYNEENQITSAQTTFLTDNKVVFKTIDGNASSSSFTFKTNDGKDDSSNTTITVNINRKPVGTLNSTSCVKQQSTLITLTATDPDAGDAISKYIISRMPGHPSNYALHDPNRNNFRILDYMMPYELAGNTVKYTNRYSHTNPSTDDILTYKAVDNHGAVSDFKSVQINITQQPFNGSGSLVFRRGTVDYNSFIDHSSSFTNIGEGDYTSTSGSLFHPQKITVGQGGARIGLYQYFLNDAILSRSKFVRVAFYVWEDEQDRNDNNISAADAKIEKGVDSVINYANGWGGYYDPRTQWGSINATSGGAGDSRVSENDNQLYVDLSPGTYYYRIGFSIRSFVQPGTPGSGIIAYTKISRIPV